MHIPNSGIFAVKRYGVVEEFTTATTNDTASCTDTAFTLEPTTRTSFTRAITNILAAEFLAELRDIFDFSD